MCVCVCVCAWLGVDHSGFCFSFFVFQIFVSSILWFAEFFASLLVFFRALLSLHCTLTLTSTSMLELPCSHPLFPLASSVTLPVSQTNLRRRIEGNHKARSCSTGAAWSTMRVPLSLSLSLSLSMGMRNRRSAYSQDRTWADGG